MSWDRGERVERSVVMDEELGRMLELSRSGHFLCHVQLLMSYGEDFDINLLGHSLGYAVLISEQRWKFV